MDRPPVLAARAAAEAVGLWLHGGLGLPWRPRAAAHAGGGSGGGCATGACRPAGSVRGAGPVA